MAFPSQKIKIWINYLEDYNLLFLFKNNYLTQTLLISSHFYTYCIIILTMYQEYEPHTSLAVNARTNFVKKVYTVLSIQLMSTVAMVYLTIAFPRFEKFQLRNTWLFWVSFVTAIVSLVALMLGRISTVFPLNFGLLSIFTLAESYMVSLICSMYTPDSVLLAAVATLSATLGLTFHAMTTKQDYTSWTTSAKGWFWSVSWAVLTISLVNAFFIKSSFITMGIAIVFAAIYSLYILIDTQLILGGKNKELTYDNYILGSAILYADIISLFLKLLQILGKKKDD